ncbi:MAG: alpha/beta hydrolase [Proteobacteria bacterium]|nr:alpha/beta hydrolase [Pseudomonadota bacterium]
MYSIPTSRRDPAEALDPHVRRFVAEVNAAYANFQGFGALTPPDARRAAEVVRAPWRAGGPTMASTRELLAPVQGGAMRIRVYDPGPAGPKAGLVYAHGGGWTLFSLDTHDRVMREYAARSGAVVIGVDYPLAPEAKYPVALHQICDVVRWLGEHGAEAGVDGSRLAIGGDSAGANLAIATALRLRDAGEGGRLGALLLNYGAYDSDCSDAAAAAYGGEGYMLTREEMRGFTANYLRTPADAGDPLACPGRARLEGLPPAFLTIPECDLLTEQNVAMAEKLGRAGVAVRALLYPGATHSFLEAVSIAPVAERAFRDASAWLRAVLAGERPATGFAVAAN